LYEFEAKAYSEYPLEELDDLLQHANMLPAADAKTFETLAGVAIRSPIANITDLALRAIDLSIVRYTHSTEIDLDRCRLFQNIV
jgi:hypothetical protein